MCVWAPRPPPGGRKHHCNQPPPTHTNGLLCAPGEGPGAGWTTTLWLQNNRFTPPGSWAPGPFPCSGGPSTCPRVPVPLPPGGFTVSSFSSPLEGFGGCAVVLWLWWWPPEAPVWEARPHLQSLEQMLCPRWPYPLWCPKPPLTPCASTTVSLTCTRTILLLSQPLTKSLLTFVQSAANPGK